MPIINERATPPSGAEGAQKDRDADARAWVAPGWLEVRSEESENENENENQDRRGESKGPGMSGTRVTPYATHRDSATYVDQKTTP